MKLQLTLITDTIKAIVLDTVVTRPIVLTIQADVSTWTQQVGDIVVLGGNTYKIKDMKYIAPFKFAVGTRVECLYGQDKGNKGYVLDRIVDNTDGSLRYTLSQERNNPSIGWMVKEEDIKEVL